MARVTLGTIAQQMGLSKFAVSRALSGKSGVSEETRRNVEAVATKLGYVKPAPSRAPSLALVFNDTDYINSELQLMVQAGVQAEAKRRGYQVARAGRTTPTRSRRPCAAARRASSSARTIARDLRAHLCPRHPDRPHQRLPRSARGHRHRHRSRPRGRRRGREVPRRARPSRDRLCPRRAALSRPHRAPLRRARSARGVSRCTCSTTCASSPS